MPELSNVELIWCLFRVYFFEFSEKSGRRKGLFQSSRGTKLDEAEVMWGLPAVKCGTRNRLLYLHF
jgi:hypothetical protein